MPEASGQDGTTQGVEIAGTGAKIEEYGVIEGGRGAESVAVPGYDHGVKDAEQRNKSENASRSRRTVSLDAVAINSLFFTLFAFLALLIL